jgi:hypothetical protein
MLKPARIRRWSPWQVMAICLIAALASVGLALLGDALSMKLIVFVAIAILVAAWLVLMGVIIHNFITLPRRLAESFKSLGEMPLLIRGIALLSALGFLIILIGIYVDLGAAPFYAQFVFFGGAIVVWIYSIFWRARHTKSSHDTAVESLTK